MDRRKIILATLVLLLAFAVPLLGQAASDPMCIGQRSVAGGTNASVRCTIATTGEALSVRASMSAAGAYTVFVFPFPPVVNAGVSILAPDGTTLLSCSHTDIVVSQCGKQGTIHVPNGTRLTCLARGWTNMAMGKALLAYGCMSS